MRGVSAEVAVEEVVVSEEPLVEEVVDGAVEVERAGDSGAATAAVLGCSEGVEDMAVAGNEEVERRNGATSRVVR